MPLNPKPYIISHQPPPFAAEPGAASLPSFNHNQIYVNTFDTPGNPTHPTLPTWTLNALHQPMFFAGTPPSHCVQLSSVLGACASMFRIYSTYPTYQHIHTEVCLGNHTHLSHPTEHAHQILMPMISIPPGHCLQLSRVLGAGASQFRIHSPPRQPHTHTHLIYPPAYACLHIRPAYQILMPMLDSLLATGCS